MQGVEVMTDKEIATSIVPCSTRAIRSARAKILKNGRIDGNPKTGRPREVTEHMWLALQSQLEQYPCMTQQDMVDFLHEKDATITISRFTIGRELKRRNWTKKVTQNVAKEQDQDLRDDYIERRSHYKPEQMIFIDESGSDRGIAIPGRGYAPKGVTPVQVKRFHRGRRVQILPAYTVDGIIYSEVYEENTDHEVFEGFIERLLPFCGRFPGPRSVIFMDNASFHFSPKINQMLAQAGVVQELQAPYSPDLNPIEPFFGSLKNRIRKMARQDADLIRADFKEYLRMQIRIVGQDKKIVKGHFRMAQIRVDEPVE